MGCSSFLFSKNNKFMILEKSFNKKRKKMITIVFFLFLFLALFYKWQIATSSEYLSFGNENYKIKDYNESLKNYKYAAAFYSDRKIIYFAKIKRAEIFYKFNQLDKAEQELKEALKEIDNNFRAYEIMGDICYKKRDLNGSLSNYEKAISLENKKEINLKLAKSFIAIGNYEKANTILLKALSESQDDEILYYLGLLEFNKKMSYNNYFQKIKEKDVSDYKEKVFKINKYLSDYCDIKNEVYSNILIADLYNMLDEPYLSMQKSKKEIEKNEEYRDAHLLFGESNFIIGDYQESYKSFQKAFSLDNNNPETNFWMSAIYEKLGNDLKYKEFIKRYNDLKLN